MYIFGSYNIENKNNPDLVDFLSDMNQSSKLLFSGSTDSSIFQGDDIPKVKTFLYDSPKIISSLYHLKSSEDESFNVCESIDLIVTLIPLFPSVSPVPIPVSASIDEYLALKELSGPEMSKYVCSVFGVQFDQVFDKRVLLLSETRTNTSLDIQIK